MDIVINAIGLPFNGETIKTQSLGGSESAAYYLARGLAARGHRVTMFTTSENEGSWDGVTYVNAGALTQAAPLGERFTFYAINTPHDVLIAQRHPLAFHKDFASKINVWQLHDLALHRTAGMIQGGLPRIDFTTTVSEFHAKQVSEVYGIPREAIRVVPNGVDLSLYATKLDDVAPVAGLGDIRGFRMLYQSRPERGLEHLVRPGGIMDRLRGTPARLLVCGYENTVAQMAPYYDQLKVWAAALPNVTQLGALTKPRLADLQRQCDLLCYPTEFEEVSCITAMEAMAAHLPMLTSKHGALPETCKDSGTILVPLKDGVADEGAFVTKIHELMNNLHDPNRERVSRLGQLAAAQMAAGTRFSWDRATDVLIEALEKQFAARCSNSDRVLRHCIEYSDIAFLDWYVNVNNGPAAELENTRIGRRSLLERESMFKFIETEDASREHYDQLEVVNYGRMVDGGLDIATELEQLENSPRMRGMVSLLGQAVAARPGRKLRVLEFGCAHGHITLGLAKLFPAIEFVGMDFVGRSIGKAIESAQKLGVPNASFVRGGVADLETMASTFDIVIAAEVVEHIYDYLGALYALRATLTPNGYMLFTTPAGRWEWSGHDDFKSNRMHLHHFERGDWQDILAEHPDHQIVYAPFSADEAAGFRGSWIVGVNVNDAAAFRPVDYARKLAVTAPRETVSACLIVRNGALTIGKALTSIAGWVDEVVIGVDPSTSDDTAAAVAAIMARFPWTSYIMIEGVEALKDGFDAARNRTVDAASGDWILWMDADEECPGIPNAWRLLRPSAFNAYGTPQIHYSAQPPQVLTTDYPARLFRNNRGVRFFGLVHEHPEDSPGKAIAGMNVIHDVQFLHNGYVDERTRRARYNRNLPLLMRDITAHPDRILNKFLLLRDLAQGIGFERQAGIPMNQDQANRATQGVAIMHEMIGRADIPLRMVLDSLQYYSICNEILGAGFVAKVSWETGKPPIETLGASGVMEARVHDRAVYLKLLTRIAEESTKHYESQYA